MVLSFALVCALLGVAAAQVSDTTVILVLYGGHPDAKTSPDSCTLSTHEHFADTLKVSGRVLNLTSLHYKRVSTFPLVPQLCPTFQAAFMFRQYSEVFNAVLLGCFSRHHFLETTQCAFPFCHLVNAVPMVILWTLMPALPETFYHPLQCMVPFIGFAAWRLQQLCLL